MRDPSGNQLDHFDSAALTGLLAARRSPTFDFDPDLIDLQLFPLLFSIHWLSSMRIPRQRTSLPTRRPFPLRPAAATGATHPAIHRTDFQQLHAPR